jgi:hypothetical protein
MNVVLVDLYAFNEFMAKELLPAAEDFKTMEPDIKQLN